MIFHKLHQPPIAIVDYEHWLVAMKNLYKSLPDVHQWAREVRTQYGVEEIRFYANFNHPNLKKDIPLLRQVSDSVIETDLREDSHPMKDMSDIIMIDALYRLGQKRRSPKTIILFTGDGHFQPVTRYLTQDCKKQVILYGIRGATSRMLKQTATQVHEWPTVDGQKALVQQLITDEVDRLTLRYGEVIASISSLSQKVASSNSLPESMVQEALRDMITQGLISLKRRRRQENHSTFLCVCPEWDRLIEAGFYTPEE